jgi:carboxyl-terminal processing protease
MLTLRSFARPGLLLALALLCTRDASAQASYEQLQTFSSLLNQIRASYVDSVTYAELVHAAIDGVLGSLDPHSRFLKREDGEREAAYEAGMLAGTGVYFDEVDGSLVVLAVMPGTPGARAGVSPGDRLLTINDTSSAGLSAYEVVSRLIGPKGTKVRLLFERGSRLEPDSVKVNLKFDMMQPRSVTVSRLIDPTTGYVRLSGFGFKASDEVQKAIKDLRSAGARRMVLDLRGNPGGLVFAAVEISSLFLPKKSPVFRTVGRRRAATEEFATEKDGPFRELPLILLIDGGSASASEAVAGSLQDHDRALVVGRRSFGKALMQQGFPVPPQGDFVYLTVGRIATPSGRIIQRSYHGLKASQYYSFAGRSGAEQDTTEVFHTDHQRPVRGGGGIAPDVPIEKSAELPVWWGFAADSGWIEAVADSAAALLPKDRTAGARWSDNPAEWQTGMVNPFLNRVKERLKVGVDPDSATRGRIGRILAYRASEVRWGPDAAEALQLRYDPDIRVAMGYWDKLESILRGN